LSYAAALNESEQENAKDQVQKAIVDVFNISKPEDVKITKFEAASMRRRLLSVEYAAEFVISGLNEADVDVLKSITKETLAGEIATATGANVTVTSVASKEVETSLPTTSASTGDQFGDDDNDDSAALSSLPCSSIFTVLIALMMMC